MWTLALAAGLSGCEDEYVPKSTADWDLSEVSVMCSLRSNGEGVLVSMHASVPSDNEVPSVAVLGPKDTLAAAVGGDPPLQLDKLDESGFDRVHFFPAAVSEVGLELAREGERIAATIALPAAFVVTGPSEPIASDEPIELSWEPAGDLPIEDQMMSLSVWGDCMRTTTFSLELDAGGYTIEPGDLVFDEFTGDCQLTLSLDRTRYRLESIGPGGLCYASQVRTIQITVTR